MKISVTKADIAKGESRNSNFCPVALALKRSGFPEARVGQHYIWRVIEGGFLIPQKIQRFIKKFDNKKPVKPITFNLPIQ